MGTLAAVEAWAPGRREAERALEAGFAALADADRLLHPTRAPSELATLNATAVGCTVTVGAWTSALLRLSRELCLLSAGLFEPALPGQGSILHWLPVGARRLQIQRSAFIDLGGIAKGFAVDQAVVAMRRAGASRGLVNAGGDLRVFGRGSWPITLRGEGQADRQLLLVNSALAVSDPRRLQAPLEHRGYRLPPAPLRRRRPRAVAVVAPRAALADALTKALMYATPTGAGALLARFRACEIGAVNDSGTVARDQTRLR
jgi:thiamine biosynthesis lipoprotein